MSQASDPHIKILTWNLAKGIGDLEEIAARIDRAGVDICCFQETNGKVEEAVGKRFKPLIIHSDEFSPSNLPENASNSAWTLIIPSGKQGWIRNSILTRLPVNKITRIDLPHEARDALLCQMEVSVGKKQKINCAIINLHLTSGREKTTERSEQLRHLLDQLDLDANYLILGDYNLARDECPWPPTHFNTFPLVDTYSYNNPMNKEQSWRFHHPFDRCLYRGFLEMAGDPIILGHDFKASDHYGVIFPVNVGKKPTGAMSIPSSESAEGKKTKKKPVEEKDKTSDKKEKGKKEKEQKEKEPIKTEKKGEKKPEKNPEKKLKEQKEGRPKSSPPLVISPSVPNNSSVPSPQINANSAPIPIVNPVIPMSGGLSTTGTIYPLVTSIPMKRERKSSRSMGIVFTEETVKLSEIKKIN